MQTTLFYIFSPTEALLSIAHKLIPEEVEFLKPEVWSVMCHDRIGCEQQRDDVEAAFWNTFLAQQIYDAPEPRHRTEFRTGCLTLGFASCWAVSVTKRGGPAKELIDEAKEAALFLADNGIVLPLASA